MRYPVLLLSSSEVISMASQAELEAMIGRTTNVAERARYWDSAVLVDRDLEQYAISELELGGRTGPFTWLKRTRPVLHWAATSRGPVDLVWVKERAAKVLSEYDLDPAMRDDLLRAIERAPTIDAVCTFLAGKAMEDYRSVKGSQAPADSTTRPPPIWPGLLIWGAAIALTFSVIGPVKTLLWQLLVVPWHVVYLLARRTLPDWATALVFLVGWVTTMTALRVWGPADAFLGGAGAFYTACVLWTIVDRPRKTTAVSRLIFPDMTVEAVASSAGTVLLTGKDYAGAPLEILFMGATVTASTNDLPQGVGSGTVIPVDGDTWTIAFADDDGAVFMSIAFASSMYRVAGRRWCWDRKGW